MKLCRSVSGLIDLLDDAYDALVIFIVHQYIARMK